MPEIQGLKRQALIVDLAERMLNAGSWCGETHLQKSVFFLQEMLGVPTGYDYILYKHGPYSFDLHDELTVMRANLVLDLQPQGPFGPSFRPGEAARLVEERFPKTLAQYERPLDFVARALSTRNVAALERLGTAYYVCRHSWSAQREELARRVTELKPHIPFEAALQAVGEVEVLCRQAKEEGILAAA